MAHFALQESQIWLHCAVSNNKLTKMNILLTHPLVLEMYLRIEIELSDEPYAKTSPGSYDDHCTELAEESCLEWMYN